MSVRVTEDEADKKRREYLDRARENPEYQRYLAQRGLGDRTAVQGKKDDKHYRWVSKRRVEERKGQGYKVVTPDSGEMGVASQINVDNTIGIKDELVLMAEPRELHELKKEQDREIAETRFRRKMEADREGLEKKARDLGLAKAHQDVVVDRSREGSPSEAMVVAKRKLPS